MAQKDWQLVKKIQGLDLTQKCFEPDELPQSDNHEAEIPRFRDELEGQNIEIFEVKGHQFITEDGVYTITHKSEIQYGGN